MATPQLDLAIRNRLAENNQKNLDRINAALKQTLEEIAFLEKAEKLTPGAYGAALEKLRVKRDRQAANATATANYINALKADK